MSWWHIRRWALAIGAYALLALMPYAHPIVSLPLIVAYASASVGFVIAASAATTILWMGAVLELGSTYDLSFLPNLTIGTHLVLAVVALSRGNLVSHSGSTTDGFVSEGVVCEHSLLLFLSAASLALLIFRDVPIFATVCVAAVLTLFWHAMWPPARPASTMLRTGIANSLLVIGGLAIGLCILEGGARLLVRPESQAGSIFRPHPKYVFDLRPGADTMVAHRISGDKTQTQAVRAVISSQALRDREYGPKAPNEFRVLLLGDSFTFGQAVEASDTISAYLGPILQRARPDLAITVINFGVPGSGPWQQLGYLSERGFALQPDVVIHQLYLGNDLENTLLELDKHLRAGEPEWAAQLEMMRRDSTPRFLVEAWLAEHSRAYAAARRQISREVLNRFLCEGLRVLPRLDASPVLFLGRLASWECNLDEWYPNLNEAFERMMTTLTETKRACDEHGCAYAVYTVPLAEEIVPEWFEVHVAGGGEYTAFRCMNKLHDRLGAASISFFSTVEGLRNYPGSAPYLEFDGHTTPEGNQIIAQAIADYVIRKYFTREPVGPIN